MAKWRAAEHQARDDPKGAPNKVAKALKDMILGPLSNAGGQDYLRKRAVENPVAFMSLIGKVLATTLAGADGGRCG